MTKKKKRSFYSETKLALQNFALKRRWPKKKKKERKKVLNNINNGQSCDVTSGRSSNWWNSTSCTAQLYANNINKYWHCLSTLMGLQAARSYYNCYHGYIIILRQQNKVWHLCFCENYYFHRHTNIMDQNNERTLRQDPARLTRVYIVIANQQLHSFFSTV